MMCSVIHSKGKRITVCIYPIPCFDLHWKVHLELVLHVLCAQQQMSEGPATVAGMQWFEHTEQHHAGHRRLHTVPLAGATLHTT
jgi:hypothetical protein